jgi:hypothetical protein
VRGRAAELRGNDHGLTQEESDVVLVGEADAAVKLDRLFSD